jgi:hypothetical protein
LNQVSLSSKSIFLRLILDYYHSSRSSCRNSNSSSRNSHLHLGSYCSESIGYNFPIQRTSIIGKRERRGKRELESKVIFQNFINMRADFFVCKWKKSSQISLKQTKMICFFIKRCKRRQYLTQVLKWYLDKTVFLHLFTSLSLGFIWGNSFPWNCRKWS